MIEHSPIAMLTGNTGSTQLNGLFKERCLQCIKIELGTGIKPHIVPGHLVGLHPVRTHHFIRVLREYHEMMATSVVFVEVEAGLVGGL
ncbi:MAG: hypothetical protein O3C57_08600 [Verrucomicrobia bacterium]|nr:hypothetical protein [Verrucomicrobiota bacterium]